MCHAAPYSAGPFAIEREVCAPIEYETTLWTPFSYSS
ncbi:hypothetical protein ACVLVH_001334 [Kluyvera sp. 1366]